MMDNFTARELSKKYNHTTAQIQFKKDKLIRTVYFDGFGTSDDGEHICIIHYNATGFPSIKKEILGGFDYYSEKVCLKDFIILPMPDKQVFDFGGRTLVYSRYPQRQWRKGMCSDNASLRDCMYDTLTNIQPSYEIKVNLVSLRLDLKPLHNMNMKNYAGNLARAIADITSYELLSRAISEVYWLGLFVDEDKPFIFYRYDLPIAYYNNKSDVFTLVDKIYLQEITDFCNRFNESSKIEV